MSVHLHEYKREFGGTQEELVILYQSLGKDYDQIQNLLKCPRASIRRICNYHPRKQEEILSRVLNKRATAAIMDKIPNLD